MASFKFYGLEFTIRVQGYGRYLVSVLDKRGTLLSTFCTDNSLAYDRCNALDEDDVYCNMSIGWRREEQNTSRRELFNEYKRTKK